MIYRIASITAICLIGLIPYGESADNAVKRGRDEGTYAIAASNVTGSGNISAYGALESGYGLNGFRIEPVIGAQIGVGSVLQFSGQMIPIGLKGIGPIEAHLQATFPGNDKLRLFGIAARGDLYLSTTADTLNKTSDTSKPEFRSYILPSIITDVDFLGRYKSLPLKIYLMGGLVDNPSLLFRYNQIAVRYGAEWKTFKHSIFVDGGLGFYKETPNRTNNFVPEKSYGQSYGWLAPGARYRLFDRFSLLGSLRFTWFANVKKITAVHPEFLSFSLRIEAPIFFRETNSEAIRTLIFMEQEKDKQASGVAQDVETKKEFFDKFGLEGADTADKAETFDYQRENEELKKQRKDIQDKMDTIEKMLEDIGE